MNAGTGIDTYNITWDDLSCEDFLFNAITNDGSLHSDITLERSHDIGGLLLLVPTDDGVEHKNTNDDTEIDPVAKASSEENSNFHDWNMR
jgi:hypothetical protein